MSTVEREPFANLHSLTAGSALAFATRRPRLLCFVVATLRRRSGPNRHALRPAISPFPPRRSSLRYRSKDAATENKPEPRVWLQSPAQRLGERRYRPHHRPQSKFSGSTLSRRAPLWSPASEPRWTESSQRDP